MKARNFHDTTSPIVIDPTHGTRVNPPAAGGAQLIKPAPVGHSGQPGAAPPARHVPPPAPPAPVVYPVLQPEALHREPLPSSSAEEAVTELPPPPSSPTLTELEQLVGAILPAMKEATEGNERDRLVGVACSVLRSEPLISLLSEDLEELSGDGRTVRPGRVEALAHRVVRFADELVRSATSLVERREAPTQP